MTFERKEYRWIYVYITAVEWNIIVHVIQGLICKTWFDFKKKSPTYMWIIGKRLMIVHQLQLFVNT